MFTINYPNGSTISATYEAKTDPFTQSLEEENNVILKLTILILEIQDHNILT